MVWHEKKYFNGRVRVIAKMAADEIQEEGYENNSLSKRTIDC